MIRRTPGVYVEEVPSGPRAIDGAPTAVAAFIGVAGPPDEPAHVTGRAEFDQRWPAGTAVAAAAAAFFDNGGSQAWIAPVANLDPISARAAVDALHKDVGLVALVADPPAAPAVIAAAAPAVSAHGAMLLVEGPWPDAAAATQAMADDPVAAIGATGPDLAVYWPRLVRPAAGGDHDSVSPLGSVAGVFARTDAERGVWKAPAGVEATIAGALGTAQSITDGEHGVLNRLGVNALREIRGRGPLVWGSRTQSIESEWIYVPVRRTALHLERSVARGLTWTVFEPNDEPLWLQVRDLVDAFLSDLFRRGAFAGRTPKDSFFVRCDRSTMSQTDVQSGRLVVQIGFAPQRPAEFVVLRIEARAAPS